MIRILAAAVLALSATTSFAAPKLERGAEKLCSGYAESVELMWLGQRGEDFMRARVATNGDGVGCYAWLSTAPAIQLTNAGSILYDMTEKSRARWRLGDRRNGVVVDFSGGDATFILQGQKVPGRILR